MSIEIEGVSKRFGTFTALDNINLSIATGKITALLGPSGSGKTTLLRIIAGLETPDTGSIKLFGVDATGVKTRERRVGFVFQHYALFKHMTVFENVAFGLTIKPRKIRPSREEIRAKVNELLSLVQLQGMANRLPSELSGGQKQRVALARALAIEPQVLLLDEPFGALDAKVRAELRRWLRVLHDRIHVTSVFVTHDQEEALEVSDTIVILNKGRIEQVGSPEEVYDKPANPFVYGFLGSVNLFHARMEKAGLNLAHREDVPKDKNDVSVFVRPQDVTLAAEDSSGKGIAVTVAGYRPLGSRVRVELRTVTGDKTLEAEITRDEWQVIKTAAGAGNAVTGKTLYALFTSGKIYSADNRWSDYTI